MSQHIIDYVSKYYSEKMEAHGATPRGVDWNGTESQELRFAQLVKICPPDDCDFTLLDYGCGYGALYDFMHGLRSEFSYVGYDCATSMIERAIQLHSNAAKCTFYDGLSFNRDVDYVISSGIFNVRGQYSDADWLEYCCETIRHISSMSSKGFAFNMLSCYSDADKMRDYLYYADPSKMFEFCKRELSSNVALLHDYGLYEFTLLVRK